jgi:hypothetical protein
MNDREALCVVNDTKHFGMLELKVNAKNETKLRKPDVDDA